MGETSIDRLFAETLSGDYDDDQPWRAVHKLRMLGSADVLRRAIRWCESEEPLQRARGADVLAQLGRTLEHPTNKFPAEAYKTVFALVEKEKDELPLMSGIYALGHIGNPLAVPAITVYASHPSANIRYAVTCALGNYPNDATSVSRLVDLTRDSDGDVRDWATFGLGVLGDVDSQEVRQALLNRLADEHADAAEEAASGLAKRKDSRVVEFLLSKLQGESVSSRVLEACALMLNEVDAPERSPKEYAIALQQMFPNS